MAKQRTPRQREFDVVVWGATGFTGRLVAEHLANTYGSGESLSWAIAGRDPDKLEALRGELGNRRARPAMILAESHDVETLRQLASRTRVVATTVGPYSRLGSELVAECARNGTHYCDLAGEVPWIRRMISAHDDTARRSGALIVNCCGFDSIPSDLGVWFLQREARARHGKPLQRVHLYVEAMQGSFSGGTAASLLEVAAEARADRRTARLLMNPYALNPRGDDEGDDTRDAFGIGRDDLTGEWVAPFIMAGINTRIVRRSNALLGKPYGRHFQYAEFIKTGGGLAGFVRAAAIGGATGGMLATAITAPGRSLLRRFVFPDPGDGPDAEARAAGHFRLRLVGIDEDGERLAAIVTGDRDPGYGCTSRMLGESAVALAQAKNADGDPGGFLTPAAALGDALIDRLTRNAGMTFSIVDVEPADA